LQLQLWQWSVATPSELFDWQVSYLDINLLYVYGCDRWLVVNRVAIEEASKPGQVTAAESVDW